MTRADYTEMPWANGRGSTIEILRKATADGAFLWRFSMAKVSENGPFSQFPNIDRNLTVIDGPGFDLAGTTTFRADPLHPVAFPGDLPLSAANVTGVAVDFNVMTQRALPKPRVSLVQNQTVTTMQGATLCIFALAATRFGATSLNLHDFLYNTGSADITGGPALVIHLFETPQSVST
ncbi:HutD/Ves family protein [Pseudorhodobacter ferrugineus]|nr:HutD family protein [Pseudorhodobacter ferrugineus]